MEQTIHGTFLALDTSTAAMAAAIIRNGEVLTQIESLAERNHSVHVITHLKDMLKETCMQSDHLDAIVVGNGPGSYTGMRIAVTAAKTLAWTWEKPLIGISSLEAIAYGALHAGLDIAYGEELPEQSGEHWLLPIMDARRGQVYSAGFGMGNVAGWHRWLNDGVRMMREWTDEITTAAEAYSKSGPLTIWLTGDLSLHEESAALLQERCGGAGVKVRLLPHVLQGSALAYLGAQRFASGARENVHGFTPNYTQLTEAEVKWNAREAEEAKS
ncbi:tRNA (adenosine(37)-N6)-threonylcarbamoyltransferase complex dimerization subunit type 1 TsaB [Paenibacillus paeoniae]|uniref:tRNA (Adenosine(37)-N6)-threonylcarbamoyltransferase complex dimerization subunit type 1 TsaB n=1 Tax=Paenibacillus paeoniae TaxID=2292705 RepID=A0A371P7F4_9BACL|nr:tRNA (adenosine(37)-N6)-threonylcarbamoyltransferase complex dimerization subunit type 1 TsaB [Paenibacillus paeoniae]REK71468.1 tRNA (adenosine(37)-N6)-threonylcarbamoyltransferase complex dimerization subunit type 1 TsaB [Paenibacillus paeoniae]